MILLNWTNQKERFTNDFSPLSERRQGVIALPLIQTSGSLRAATARISQTLSRIWSLAVRSVDKHNYPSAV